MITPALLEKARLLAHAENYQEAIEILQPELSAQSSELHVNLLCACLIKIDDFNEAVGVLQEVDKETKLTATQLRLLASSLTQLSLCEEAHSTFNRIIDIHKNPRALQDYALNFLRMGKADEARAILKAALTGFPDDSRLMLQEGLLGLKFGIDEVSRKNYFKRHLINKTEPLPQNLAPLWWDSELSGKHILLWGEQGIGDELIFFLVLKILTQANVTCSVACETRLVSLLSHNFPSLEIVIDRHDRKAIAALSRTAVFDFQARVGDLWQLVEINANALPNGPLLEAPDNYIEDHRATFPAAESEKTIGIAWYSKDPRNNMPDVFLDRIYRQLPANWLSLQHSIADKSGLGNSLIRQKAATHESFTANDDFCAYAASILNTDMVITNDTTAGVFATLLGKTTLVLCPADPFWFWSAHQRLGNADCTTVLARRWNQSWDQFYDENVLPFLASNNTVSSGGNEAKRR